MAGERYVGWGLESMTARSGVKERATAERGPGQLLYQPIAFSGFTAINKPFTSQPSIQPADYQEFANNDNDFDSQIGAPANHVVAEYLGRGENFGDIRFGRRLTAPARSNSDEDFYSTNVLSSHELSKKRSSTAASKPAKKTRSMPKASIADGLRIIKPYTRSAQASIDGTPKGFKETSQIAISDVPSDSEKPSEETIEKLNAFIFQPNHLRNEDSSSNSATINATQVSPVISTSSPSFMGNGVRHKSSETASQLILQGVNKEQTQVSSRLSRRASSMRTLLPTIPEESPPRDDIESVARSAPRFEPPHVQQYGDPAKVRGAQETGTDIPDDFFDSDEFEGLEDEDLLDLEFPETSDPANLFCKPLTTQDNTQMPTPQHSDSFRSAADCDDEWDILEENVIDISDLDTIDLTLDSASLFSRISNSIPYQQRQAPTPQLTSSATRVPEISETLEEYAKSILHPRIVRPPFPTPIRDRSPIIGITASSRLRTCFRVGEALNAGCSAVRNSGNMTSNTILIELYAKISSSHREEGGGVKQYFTFVDLFTEDRPPFVQGICECWKASELWEYDCGRFITGAGGELEENKLCRTVGRMRREGKGWRFVVLNIWEATWDDVEYARAIICGDG